MRKAALLAIGASLLLALSLSVLGCDGFDSLVPIPQRPVSISGWKIELNGGGWQGGEVSVGITITNTGKSRKDFDDALWSSPELIAIDSYDKVVEPSNRGGFWTPAAWYRGEYYPEERRTGTIKFPMSPYSGATKLCIEFGSRRYTLFDLGEPLR